MDTTLIKLTAHKFDAKKFYDLLFQKHPETRAMFPEDMTRHYQVFTDRVSSLITRLDDFDSIKMELMYLGRRHSAFYGVRPEHYELVGQVLLESLELETPAQKEAWASAYAAISSTMMEADS